MNELLACVFFYRFLSGLGFCALLHIYHDGRPSATTAKKETPKCQ